MPITSRATGMAPSSAGVFANARMTKTRTKVAMASVTKFQP